MHSSLRNQDTGRTRGYTLIETLVAVSILLVGVAAAAQLSLAMRKQEEANANVARALNLAEQAHRLYQLGLGTGEVLALLPPDPCAAVSSGAHSLSIPAELPNLEAVSWSVDCTVVPGQSETRRFSTQSMRPSIR